MPAFMKSEAAQRDPERYRELRRAQRRRYYDKTAFAKNQGHPWSVAETALVLKAAEDGTHTDSELSEMLQRSVASIQSHRSRMRAKGFTSQDFDEGDALLGA